MTARALFRRMLAERREYPRGSAEWTWRTRAAVTYLRIVRGIPAAEWT